jgi:serine phosphatase RsbU (regulator of sigma subunit)
MQNIPRIGLTLSTCAGVALAILLCAQCVSTYLYLGRVLVPQEAGHEAERQAAAIVNGARSAGVTEPAALSPVLERVREESSGAVVWLRLLTPESRVLAESGTPQGRVIVPPRWWSRAEEVNRPFQIVDTPKGKALVTLLSFRMPRPPAVARPESRSSLAPGDERPRGTDRRPIALPLEVAIRLDAVATAFSGLRQNLVSGVLAAAALLVAIALIGFRTPSYLRGKYLDKEMAVARRVQSDLLPKAGSISRQVEFAAAALAADQVGGDFHDIFETDGGGVSVVLGDASGKGIPAALLASVTQGAIRSADWSHLETACERINRMLCDKTASERFVTLFWGIYDPLTATLRYVNAGHSAPLLLKANAAGGNAIERLDEGGPVFGALPLARYRCGAVGVAAGDTLVVYSDGINEATDPKEEQFGDERILEIAAGSSALPADAICNRIMSLVARFAAPGALQDDRTLMVVRFLKSRAAATA